MRAGELELDPGFVRRTVITTIVVGLLGGLVAFVYLGALVAAGVLAGAIVGAANLWFLWKLIQLVVAPVRGSTRAIVSFALMKIVFVYGLGAALLVWGKLPAVWLLVGFSLILLVAVLKVAGLLLTATGSGASRGKG